MLNIAMLSKWHVHAGGYAKFIQNQPDAQVTCVWDEDAARGQAWAEELGVPFVADLDALLARDDVDAVAIDTRSACASRSPTATRSSRPSRRRA